MAENQDQTVSEPHDEAADEAFSVGFPLTELNTTASVIRTNVPSEWVSNQESTMTTEPSPLTRSIFLALQPHNTLTHGCLRYMLRANRTG